MHGSSCYGYTEMFTEADLVEYKGTTLCLLTFTPEEAPTPTEAPTEQTGQVCRSIMENKRGNAASGWVGEMNNIGKSIEDCGQAVLNAGPYVAAYMHGSSCYGYTEMFTEADLMEYKGTTLCLLTFTPEGNGQSDGGCPTWINDYVGQFYTYDEEKGAWYDDFGTIEVPFTCNDGKCIPEHWRCDGGPDCDGGEDESTCEAPTTISTTEAITPAKTTPAAFVMPEGEVNTSFLGGECIKAGNEGTAVCMQLCIDQGCYGIDWNKSARPWMNCRCWLHRKEPKTIKNNNKIDHYRNPQYD